MYVRGQLDKTLMWRLVTRILGLGLVKRPHVAGIVLQVVARLGVDVAAGAIRVNGGRAGPQPRQGIREGW